MSLHRLRQRVFDAESRYLDALVDPASPPVAALIVARSEAEHAYALAVLLQKRKDSDLESALRASLPARANGAAALATRRAMPTLGAAGGEMAVVGTDGEGDGS